jgi:hypothetical protein
MRFALLFSLTVPFVLGSCMVTPENEAGGDGSKPNDGTTDGNDDPTGHSEMGEAEAESGSDSETGEPCGPYETTEVEACPMIIGEGFCSEGGGHEDPGTEIEWMNNPPHSGRHYSIWETMKGEHNDLVERGYWVHNLEHGWIVLVYNCPEDCDAELDVLREVIAMREEDASLLMTEDPLLDGPRFAAISWTWVHEFDTPVLEDLLCFVDQHFDHSPESVL